LTLLYSKGRKTVYTWGEGVGEEKREMDLLIEKKKKEKKQCGLVFAGGKAFEWWRQLGRR